MHHRFILFVFLLAPLSSQAQLWLPAVFSDGMVVQHDKPLVVWGKDTPGTSVIVDFGGSAVRTTAEEDGAWRTRLIIPEVKGSSTLTIEGTTTNIINNVLVGEVWLASGQSNMDWPLERSLDGGAAVAESTNYMIRVFTVKQAFSDKPLDALSGRWEAPQLHHSAVAYHFARRLNQALNRPIGIIQSTWGGTPIHAWTPRATLEALPEAAPLLEGYRRLSQEGLTPEEAKEARRRHRHPARLYNAMIHPLQGYGLKGCIWYQGESNADFPHAYAATAPAMVKAWRQAWQDPGIGFFAVQLANFRPLQSQPSEGGWAWIREAQMSILALPHTGAATAVDVGMANNIHPRDKATVGGRLAMSALNIMYDRKDLPAGSPRPSNITFKGPGAIVDIAGANGQLVYRPTHEKSGFALQGADGSWHWADVEIKGEQLHITSSAVPAPKAVRYAWASNPHLSVFSGIGLPLLPFRSDREAMPDAKNN